MAPKPERVVIRSYQVGFGDCYLLTFVYAADDKRHVLIDFGSTSLPKNAPKDQLVRIAKDIEKFVGNQPLAVVATHRHRDHISGFETRAHGKGSGDIIRSLKPKVVVQPWTEHPDIEENATKPKARQRSGELRMVAALLGMNAVAERLALDARSMRHLPKEMRDYLSFHGENNVKNLSAVKNLMKMGKAGKASYVHAGKKSGLEDMLPGVKIHVLGPPTVEQHDGVRKQRSRHPDQFWLSQAAALRRAARSGGKAKPLFPRHVESSGPRFPVDARWFVYKARTTHSEQLLQIVTMLDNALNNTSVILLFEVGKKLLLFPGDAQWENWEFALSQADNRKLLESVDLYKVGHHGSLNATPKDLWKLFKKRGEGAKRMRSLLSTMPGKHGNEQRNTEVPRRPLLAALKRDTDHFSTAELAEGVLSKDIEIDLA
jgi:hypothetical protein